MNSNIVAQSAVTILQQKLNLLKMEYAFEKESFKQQSEIMGITRKIKRGMAWFPINVGRSYYNSLDQLVNEVYRTEDKEIEHGFEFGRPVVFFTQEVTGKIHYFNFTGTVSFVNDDLMVVILPNAGSQLELQAAEAPIGVQIYFDEFTYKLMFEAMNRVIEAKKGRLAELRDIFHGAMNPSRFSFDNIRLPWLNTSQELAVNNVLRAKDVAVVHGPPGTGKTTTLVEAVYETLRRENQVLVCAQSNMAVDWISEKLIERGVPVLRIGNPVRVNDKMLSYTYERKFEAHPDYPQLWSIRKAIRELYDRKNMNNKHEKISALKDRATAIEMRINESLFNEARVIASTLTGSANHVLLGQKYGTLFIDEAAQALEPVCWIAIQKADRVILAGDHCQLPPTIKCPEAAHGGLARTLMEDIVNNQPSVVSLLTTQYRMNEKIMHFSSEWFYHGQVKPAPEVKNRGILDLDTPIEWINTSELDFKEAFIGETFGRINKQEGQLSINLLKQYIEKIGKHRFLEERIDVGLISPYKAQVQYLRRLIKQAVFFKPFRPHITINTVDGFQGQERDVIMISLVRANDSGEIGFLSDLRRMNVAITRARMKLIILGDAHTLARHPFYKKLYEYIASLHK